MKCKRCSQIIVPKIKMGSDMHGVPVVPPFGFCEECCKQFEPLLEQLHLAFIHHYMHPEKKTIYVHDTESKRHEPKLKLQGLEF